MWYFKEKIINSPTTITIGDLRYGKEIFEDANKLKELGIKPYREVRPDRRYWDMGQVIFDTSGDEVVATYPKKGKNTDVLKLNMLKLIKRSSVINVGSGNEYSIANFAKIICKILNNKNKLNFNQDYPDGTMRKILDSTNIRNLGWKPKIEIKKGLIETINWYKKNFLI